MKCITLYYPITKNIEITSIMTSQLVSTSKWAAYLSSRKYAEFIEYISDMRDYSTEFSCTQGYLDYYGQDGLTTAPLDVATAPHDCSFTINNFPSGTTLKDAHTNAVLVIRDNCIVINKAGVESIYYHKHLKQCLRHLVYTSTFEMLWNDLVDYILSQDQSSFCSSRVSSYTISC